MNELRIALLLIALLVIAGIYLWGVKGRRRPNKGHRGKRLGGPVLGPAAATVAPDAEAAVDYTRTLGDLSNLVAEASHPAPRRSRIREALARARALPGSFGLAKNRAVKGKAAAPSQEAITLYVTAPPGHHFGGIAIRDAAEALGMRYGEMRVFHHHGVGRLASPAGLYCMANMLEPGSFDLNTLASCRTEGLVLIMRLPAPVEGRLVFELMLHGACRMAEVLGGEVRDAERRLLTPDELTRLRAIAAHAGA